MVESGARHLFPGSSKLPFAVRPSDLVSDSKELKSQPSDDSQFNSDFSTSGESSNRSSDSSGGYSSCEGGSYRCIATLPRHLGPVSSLAVVGNFILSGGSDGADIRVWRQPDMTEVWRFGAGEGSVKALINIGEQVFSAHQDMKIRVWKLPEEQENSPKMVAVLPTLKDFLLRFIPPKNYVRVRRHKTSLWIQHHDAISVLALGPGNVLYSGSWDKSIKVWRTSDFKCLESMTGHNDAVSSLVADQQGFLYSASADASVKVWTKSGKKHSLVATLETHKSSVNALVLSSDQSVLYAASSDKTVSIWERTKGENDAHMTMVGLLKGHRRAVLCMVVVDDILCTGSADKTIRVWRRNGGCHSLVTVLEGHRGPVRSVCASKEAVESGLMIYSGSLDRCVKVWWLAPMKDAAQEDSANAYDVDSPLKWRY